MTHEELLKELRDAQAEFYAKDGMNYHGDRLALRIGDILERAAAKPPASGRVDAVAWTPTKERRNHLKESIGVIEYRVLGTPYKVVQNYQIGGSWTSYRGSHCLADCVSLEAAKSAALAEMNAIAASLSSAATPVSEAEPVATVEG